MSTNCAAVVCCLPNSSAKEIAAGFSCGIAVATYQRRTVDLGSRQMKVPLGLGGLGCQLLANLGYPQGPLVHRLAHRITPSSRKHRSNRLSPWVEPRFTKPSTARPLSGGGVLSSVGASVAKEYLGEVANAQLFPCQAYPPQLGSFLVPSDSCLKYEVY